MTVTILIIIMSKALLNCNTDLLTDFLVEQMTDLLIVLLLYRLTDRLIYQCSIVVWHDLRINEYWYGWGGPLFLLVRLSDILVELPQSPLWWVLAYYHEIIREAFDVGKCTLHNCIPTVCHPSLFGCEHIYKEHCPWLFWSGPVIYPGYSTVNIFSISRMRLTWLSFL